MAAAPVLISLDEYLNTSYRPDRDYIDGEVKSATWAKRRTAHFKGFLFGIPATV